jgi:hypothetical protein
LTPENLTLNAAIKAAKGYHALHRLSICHGDSFDDFFLRNVMLLSNGKVKWLDFERADFHLLEDQNTFDKSMVDLTMMEYLKYVLWFVLKLDT